jgi:hypothetical protein
MSRAHIDRPAACLISVIASLLVWQAAPVGAACDDESAALVATAERAGRLSPQRDALYLDDRTPHFTDRRVAQYVADRWYLDDVPQRVAADLAAPTHDDWALQVQGVE